MHEGEVAADPGLGVGVQGEEVHPLEARKAEPVFSLGVLVQVEDPQEGGLARPRGAHHPEHLAGVELQVHPLKDLRGSVGLAQAPDLQKGGVSLHG